MGNDVLVSVTIPTKNVDEFMPADIGRVEIYGYTGRAAPQRGRWVEFGSLVATVPVAPPPPTPDEKPATVTPPAAPSNAPLQGARITVRDTLTPDELVQGKLPPVRPAARVKEPPMVPTTVETRPAAPEPLKRFYTALAFNERGRPGPPGADAEFTLTPVPDPPPLLDVSYTEKSIALWWEPSGGLIGYLLERTLPDEPSPIFEEDLREPAASPVPTGPVMYNIYRDFSTDFFAPPSTAGRTEWSAEPPAPLNIAPLSALTFNDSVEFGRRRCYTVRTVRGPGGDAPIGDASPAACVMPVDTFPPMTPQALATVASEGVISLIWEPNVELDLAGYIVLRGEAPGDTLQPLNTQPVRDAGYRDESVKSGVRYVYAVVAVDNRFPVPNVSTESERVEETAR